jgi:alpha-1,2-mannosyltransferase
MFVSSTAFLPSTFAMWGVMLATAASLSPVDKGWKRISFIGLCFGVSAFVGWPFVAILALPPVAEQLLLRGAEAVKKGQEAKWFANRCRNLFWAGLAAACVLVPVVALDSYAYQKLSIVPYNILSYNLPSIFPSLISPASSTSYRGPNLYGTEPSTFYLFNGVLAFNIFFVLALLSLPALVITHFVDQKRFGDVRERKAEETAPEVLLAVRLAPFYLWLAVITAQSHKEERFLFPAYGLIVLNGATTLYLARGWLETIYLKTTQSPWKVCYLPSGAPCDLTLTSMRIQTSQTSLFTNFTRTVVTISVLISFARISALHNYYHAPLNIYHQLQTVELPRLAITTFPHLYPAFKDATATNMTSAIAKSDEAIDLKPLTSLNLRLCLGKEWHRFPSHFLVPDEVEVRFFRSEFDGILPKVWEEGGEGKGLLGRATAVTPTGMNDENRQEVDRFVRSLFAHLIACVIAHFYYDRTGTDRNVRLPNRPIPSSSIPYATRTRLCKLSRVGTSALQTVPRQRGEQQTLENVQTSDTGMAERQQVG